MINKILITIIGASLVYLMFALNKYMLLKIECDKLSKCKTKWDYVRARGLDIPYHKALDEPLTEDFKCQVERVLKYINEIEKEN